MTMHQHPASETSPSPENTTTTQTVSVDASSLIVGRETRFPLYDRAGVLLLAEGSMITEVFKSKLRERFITRLDVHSDDANLISTEHVVASLEKQKTSVPCDEAIDTQLKKAVKAGLQFVTNEGTVARDLVERHGTAGYEEETRDEMTRRTTEDCEVIDDLMLTVADFRQVDGGQIRTSIDSTLKNLCQDFDCVNAAALQLSDDATLARHCYRMAVLGMSIAVELGLNEQNVSRVGTTGLVHDWGMLKVPEEIRNPSRPLNSVEQFEVQKHVMHSLDMLSRVKGLPTLVPLVSYQVHEQMNGQGYPRRRHGANIHLFARILNVAHTYVELTTAYAYRPALSPYDAMLQILKATKQGVHDPNVIRALLRAQSLFPVGSTVMLSSGRMAKVLRANGDRFTEPIVQIVQDQHGRNVLTASAENIVDLAQGDCYITQALPILHGPEAIPAPHFLKNAAALKKVQSSKTQEASNH
ncbi:HD-GYP domain-containing protein [Rubinisphaera margarita]|uniref:HD-GYP domain-containing protein n=1 Tax=Rubinisphaera margarita TaxID=2909586 RepID=UPI001EE86F96|nr:HD domain-containing phosphohydrolase [Rubinisphaera margarita]MCG6155551.1 HD domain-containing protein [Rubinisphaera margarita]